MIGVSNWKGFGSKQPRILITVLSRILRGRTEDNHGNLSEDATVFSNLVSLEYTPGASLLHRPVRCKHTEWGNGNLTLEATC
jgi:hypothetical protein